MWGIATQTRVARQVVLDVPGPLLISVGDGVVEQFEHARLTVVIRVVEEGVGQVALGQPTPMNDASARPRRELVNARVLGLKHAHEGVHDE